MTTSASADLVELVLRDAAEIQAEDAAFKEKRHRKEGRRGGRPVKPLYTIRDVDRTCRCWKPCPTIGPSRSTITCRPSFTMPAISWARR